jgi:hypothetical protein
MNHIIKFKITFTKPIYSSTKNTLNADPNSILSSTLTLFKNRVKRNVEDVYINGCIGYDYRIDQDSLECYQEEKFKLIYPYNESSSDSKKSMGVSTDYNAHAFIVGFMFEDKKKMNLCKINGTLDAIVESITSINKKSPPSWAMIENVEYIS